MPHLSEICRGYREAQVDIPAVVQFRQVLRGHGQDGHPIIAGAGPGWLRCSLVTGRGRHQQPGAGAQTPPGPGADPGAEAGVSATSGSRHHPYVGSWGENLCDQSWIKDLANQLDDVGPGGVLLLLLQRPPQAGGQRVVLLPGPRPAVSLGQARGRGGGRDQRGLVEQGAI